MANGLAKKINIFCLLAAIIAVLVLPLKKEIWYDETISMQCSKGISHDTHEQFAATNTISSSTLEQLNTMANVFNATVLDNGNSFLYNIGLHWFTALFGNSLSMYMLFSKLCGIALLIAFYFLCNLFFKDSIFTAIAVLLLATDNNILAMSHEIRAYAMGAFFTTAAAFYCFKFLYGKDNALYLFLTGLFSTGAVLSHFLSVYVVLVLLALLVYTKRAALFSMKNILAMLVPIGLIALFFYSSFEGLQIMSKQNHQIELAAKGFNIGEVIHRGMKFTAVNFKAVFPAFADKLPVVVASLLLIIALYVYGIKRANDANEKRNIHILFLLGLSGSVFLSLLCIRSQHYTALYYRYFSFSIPFCCLFITYLLSVFFGNPGINKLIKGGIAAVIILPSFVLFFMYVYRANPKLKYNHIAIADEIIKDKVLKVEVPEWNDALLIQCVLPKGYKIDYIRNPISPYFTLYKATTEEKVLVIRDNS